MNCKQRSLALLVFLALAGTVAAEGASPSGLANPFYAMDTAFAPHFRKTALSQEQGLALVKELGYAGVAWLEKSPGAVKSDLAEIEKHGLKMYAIYSHAEVAADGDLTVSKDAAPVIRVLKGHCDIFWIHISGKGPAVKTLSGKEPLVAKFRSLADTARANGLRIAIYPHLGDWTEHFEDATRLAKLVAHPNFGVSFNLCHCLATGDESRIPALLADARPVLFTATICGADSGVRAPDKELWKKLIQPLGQGTFDVGIVLGKLREIGFSGPIGFQGYGIAGEPREILAPTIKAWRRLSK
jgi:sugar phosphate isomerase/epimerase